MALYMFVQGRSWLVERRRQVERQVSGVRLSEPRLTLTFTATDGETRRSEIADDFPAAPAARLLESVWRYAEVTRRGDPGEMTSRGELVMPRMRDVLRQFLRALLLRCPNCGGRHVVKNWFRLQARCPACGIRMERGESEDYWLGGMFFNLALAETLFALGLLVVLVAMWPIVPWAGVEYSLIVAMVAAPIVLYPVSRLMWLALDLLLRPPDATEMRWHSSARDE